MSFRRRSSGRRPPPVDRGRCPEGDKRKLTAPEADQVARYQRRRSNYRGTLVPYLCPACGWHHVGNSSLGRQPRRRAA